MDPNPDDFLSLKNDDNVPTVINRYGKFRKKFIFVGFLKATDEKSWIQIRYQVYGSKDLDPN